MTPWTVAHQASLSMGFSRQEYQNGLAFPPPGDLPDSGTETVSFAALALQADSLSLSHLGRPNKNKGIEIYSNVYEKKFTRDIQKWV